MKYIQIKSIEQAVGSVTKIGHRFDNSKYWQSYYSEKASRRDTIREREYAIFFLLKSYKHAKVLDLATGCGFLPLEMHKVGFDVTCVDRYESMMKQAKRYFKKYNVDLPIIKADVTKLPFGEDKFDIVTAMSILEHLPSEETGIFLKEVSRVLKEEGLLLIHVPIKTLASRIKKWFRTYWLKDLPVWAIDDDGDVTHTMWLTVKEYSKMIEKNGFKVDYVKFNYVRSNEKLALMRLFSGIANTFDGTFMRWGSKSGFKFGILSKMAVSVAFVCHKVV